VKSETPAGPGLENSDVASGSDIQTIANRMLAGEIHPHEMPWPLWLVWSDGFRAGQSRAQVRIDRAEQAADWWYYVANNPAEARYEHERMLREWDAVQSRRETDRRLRGEVTR